MLSSFRLFFLQREVYFFIKLHYLLHTMSENCIVYQNDCLRKLHALVQTRYLEMASSAGFIQVFESRLYN
jgi:hypothetical protein